MDYEPYASRCMPLVQLRNHRAELESARDIIVNGDEYMVWKLLRDATSGQLQFSCKALQDCLNICSGRQFCDEVMERQCDEDDFFLRDFINQFIRPNMVTLGTINKMLEEVEQVIHTREKIHITLLFSFWTGAAHGHQDGETEGAEELLSVCKLSFITNSERNSLAVVAIRLIRTRLRSHSFLIRSRPSCTEDKRLTMRPSERS